MFEELVMFWKEYKKTAEIIFLMKKRTYFQNLSMLKRMSKLPEINKIISTIVQIGHA